MGASQGKREVTIPRDNVLFFETNTEGEFIFNTSRILGLNPLNPFDLSKAETMGRKQCIEIYHFLKKYVPGFEKATLVSTAPHVGIRESRHPHAKYVMTANDLVTERKFEKPIASVVILSIFIPLMAEKPILFISGKKACTTFPSNHC